MELDRFERKDLRSCGFTDNQAKSLLVRMKDSQFTKAEIRKDSYKSVNQSERNTVVERFLSEDYISTVSDRSEDQRIVNGERESLRFLDRSVKASYQLLSESTGVVISETTFRKLLAINKHVKKGGQRKRRTAACRKRDRHIHRFNFLQNNLLFLFSLSPYK